MEELKLFLASETDLNQLVVGEASGPSFDWPFAGAKPALEKSNFIVLCKNVKSFPNKVQPVAIGLRKGEEARLFARFSQTRADLSPLSNWLHVFTFDGFRAIHDHVLEPSLSGYEAAWAGLIIAEAAVLSGRSTAHLKMVACLATPSFAVARASALWGAIAANEVLEVFDKLHSQVRGSPDVMGRSRAAFTPIWAILRSLGGLKSSLSREQEAILNAIESLRRARATELDEVDAIREGLWLVPERALLDRLETMSPEERLKVFDDLLSKCRSDAVDRNEKLILAFMAAFVATIAAGGSSSFSLAEEAAKTTPEVLAFAYLLAGVGEHASWSGAFEGLGRMVSRELSRTLFVEEAPSCDFSAAEALVLVDRGLKDPLVYLKLKQNRVATVAILPGVNVQLQFADGLEPPRPLDVQTQPRVSVDPLALFAEALAPYMADALESRLSGRLGVAPLRGKKISRRV